MKKLIVCLLFLASNSFADWHGLSLPDWSTGLHVSPIASREFVNGQWLAGYSLDVFYYQLPGSIHGQPLPKLYFALDHQFNAADLVSSPSHAVGLWGPAVGVSIGGLASKLQTVIVSAVGLLHSGLGEALTLPPWITNDLDKWITLEAGGGNRVAGHLDGVKPWGAWVGGKVSITFSVLAHH